MSTRKQNKQKKIQKFIGIEKLKINELLQIRGGEGTQEDHEII
jgi:hypothetical protein